MEDVDIKVVGEDMHLSWMAIMQLPILIILILAGVDLLMVISP